PLRRRRGRRRTPGRPLLAGCHLRRPLDRSDRLPQGRTPPPRHAPRQPHRRAAPASLDPTRRSHRPTGSTVVAARQHDRRRTVTYSQHALMENRSGLLVDIRIAEANGTAERDVALQMLDEELPGDRRITVGADKAYDTRAFVD